MTDSTSLTRMPEPDEKSNGGPQSIAWSPGQVGQALRVIRLARGMSINELARESDLSGSFLSLVESGQSDLSVGRLVRVAQALGVTAAEILSLPAPPDPPVVRADERVEVPIAAEGTRLHLLAPTLDKKRTFALGAFEPGAKISMPVQNRGSEYFVWVVEGAITFEYTTGESVTLQAGDSTSRLSDECRSLANAHDGQTTFLWSQAARSSG